MPRFLNFLSALLLLGLLVVASTASAQIAPNRYRIQFADKASSPFSTDQPEEFLSQLAIERRTRQGIVVTQRDLPVNPSYIQEVLAKGDFIHLLTSKWLNAIVVETSDTLALDSIVNLPSVTGYERMPQGPVGASTAVEIKYETTGKTVEVQLGDSIDFPEYGASFVQISMLNMHWLHRFGLNGSGLQIAVLDAGFIGADELGGFAALHNEGRILGTKDFVDGDDNVYHSSTHGMRVLSCMGAVIPNELVGTAPGASFYLFRTENVASEYRIEEDNFLAACEYADSAGVDIINASLGYTTFDNPNQDYTYSDLDGNTALITRACDWAAQRGMLVVSSAGNYGNQSWFYLAAPADGDSVLTVGSVDGDRSTSSFSGRGPSADGRVKPDVAARGGGVIVANNVGGAAPSTGTSFSGPLIAGAAAALWQSKPELTNMELLQVIRESAHQFENPDDEQGYGIPDFLEAWLTITNRTLAEVLIDSMVVYPNPFQDGIAVELIAPEPTSATVSIADLTGKRLLWAEVPLVAGQNRWRWDQPGQLAAGVYIIQVVYDNGAVLSRKVLHTGSVSGQ